MTSDDPAAVVRHVLSNQKDYYAVLNVPRNTTAEAAKKSYLKLALKLHPDKNNAPGAEDAFKIIRAAVDTIQDEKKRRAYDAYGKDGVQAMESGHSPDGRPPQQQARYRGGGFRHEGDIFEEFIFGAFGGGMRQQQARQRQRGAGQEDAMQINPGLLIMLPILFFLLFAVLLQSSGSMFDAASNGQRGRRGHQGPTHASAPLFSLTREETLPYERFTQHDRFPALRVPYYVGRHFDAGVRASRVDLNQVELEVLQEHKRYLERRCYADTLRQRAKRDAGRPPVCNEYDRFDRVP